MRRYSGGIRDNILVQTFRKVGCGNNNDAFTLLKTVHLHQKLVQSLFHILLVSATALSTNSIEFVDEDNGRFLLSCSCEKLSNTLGTDSNKHLLKIGAASSWAIGNLNIFTERLLTLKQRRTELLLLLRRHGPTKSFLYQVAYIDISDDRYNGRWLAAPCKENAFRQFTAKGSKSSWILQESDNILEFLTRWLIHGMHASM